MAKDEKTCEVCKAVFNEYTDGEGGVQEFGEMMLRFKGGLNYRTYGKGWHWFSKSRECRELEKIFKKEARIAKFKTAIAPDQQRRISQFNFLCCPDCFEAVTQTLAKRFKPKGDQ